jgi:hypothetical protein
VREGRGRKERVPAVGDTMGPEYSLIRNWRRRSGGGFIKVGESAKSNRGDGPKGRGT